MAIPVFHRSVWGISPPSGLPDHLPPVFRAPGKSLHRVQIVSNRSPDFMSELVEASSASPPITAA